MAAKGITYRDAGVDITAGDRFVDQIRSSCRRTYGPRVLGGLGGFAGLFRLDYDEKLFERNYREPVLVACTDGVGTKLLIAREMGVYHTIGADLVAMNVNDMITCGAEPLFFLDYLAVHHLDGGAMATIVNGIAKACVEANIALLGGETAEMPDLYEPDDFDMAGFAVGVVERKRLIDGRRLIRPGDRVVGLSSSGVHSNGYTLVRAALLKSKKYALNAEIDALGGTLGAALLAPTRIYVRPVLDLLHGYPVKRVIRGMAHITGGGLADNIARILPKTCNITLRRKSWPSPPIFDIIQQAGVSPREMDKVFNLGIGFVLVVRPAFADAIVRRLRKFGQQAQIIGRVTKGDGRVTIK